MGCADGSKSADFSSNSPQKGVVYYHTDHLGNSHLITDSQGNVLREEVRYPYGLDRDIDDAANISADYVYTGKEHDEETGLIYFGGRYYSPEMGRWITPDRLFLEDPSIATKRPLENNLYSYVAGNPVNLIDLNGDFAISSLIGIGMLAATFILSDPSVANAPAPGEPLVPNPTFDERVGRFAEIAVTGYLSMRLFNYAFGVARGTSSFGRVYNREVPRYLRETNFGNYHQFNTGWASNSRAGTIFEVPKYIGGRQGVNITSFNRGGFRAGSEGGMLSDALYYKLPVKPDFIRFTNVGKSKLPFGNMLRTTADDLGGEISNIRTESRLVGGQLKLDVIGDIKYRFIK